MLNLPCSLKAAKKQVQIMKTNRYKKVLTAETRNLLHPITTHRPINPTTFAPDTPKSDEIGTTPRQEKIMKLKEAVTLTQEYANEIISELNATNEEVTITRDYADSRRYIKKYYKSRRKRNRILLFFRQTIQYFGLTGNGTQHMFTT